MKWRSPPRGVRRLLGEGPPCDEIPSRGGASSLAYVPRVRLILTPQKGLEKKTVTGNTLTIFLSYSLEQQGNLQDSARDGGEQPANGEEHEEDGDQERKRYEKNGASGGFEHLPDGQGGR